MDFVNDLICASVLDIVRPDKVDRLIEEIIFTYLYDVCTVYNNAMKILPHRCNDSCLVIKYYSTFQCKNNYNLKSIPDNTKHVYIPIPSAYSVPCLKNLETICLNKSLEIDNNGNVIKFESNIPFSHPKHHAPLENPRNDMNISQMEGSLFSVTQSMKNIEKLTGTGGCAKYVCKYISNIDKQNYLVIEVNWGGRFVSKATFLHSTKISSYKIDKDKEQKKNANNP